MTSFEEFSLPLSQVRMLHGQEAFAALRADVNTNGPIYCYTYLIETNFWHAIFDEHCTHSPLYCITDHRQRPLVQQLVNENRNTHAWTWATNRSLHEKTFLFPLLGVVWIGSQNMTRGSWTMSRNRAVRIHHHSFLGTMLAEWTETRNNSRAVLPIAPNHPHEY